MAAVEITIVIRATEGENLDLLISSILTSAIDQAVLEVLVIAKGEPRVSSDRRKRIRIIQSNAKRIEAKLIGARLAAARRILYLDSDQLLSPNLLGEIQGRSEKMLIIPERSANDGVMGSLLDARREYIETKMWSKPSERYPVIPRAFARDLLLHAFDAMPDVVIREVTETEDSLIFHECLKLSSDVDWCTSHILNQDPGMIDFVRKSFRYGYRNERAVLLGHLPPDYVELIRRIQIESAIGLGLPSIGAATSSLLRGVPYTAGAVLAKLRYGVR